jgi:hypothetical protein
MNKINHFANSIMEVMANEYTELNKHVDKPFFEKRKQILDQFLSFVEVAINTENELNNKIRSLNLVISVLEGEKMIVDEINRKSWSLLSKDNQKEISKLLKP